jgi:hypothetical protein
VLAITESPFVEPRRGLLTAGKLVEMEITGSRESFCNSLLLWIRLTFRGGFRDHKVS